jgi:hypothetical protein
VKELHILIGEDGLRLRVERRYAGIDPQHGSHYQRRYVYVPQVFIEERGWLDIPAVDEDGERHRVRF